MIKKINLTKPIAVVGNDELTLFKSYNAMIKQFDIAARDKSCDEQMSKPAQKVESVELF